MGMLKKFLIGETKQLYLRGDKGRANTFFSRKNKNEEQILKAVVGEKI